MLNPASATLGFKFPVMRPHLPAYLAIEPYLRELDANRWYTNFGPLVQKLEARLARHYGAPAGSVCTMANATLGIVASLQEAAAPKTGGVCLMPSWAFAAAAHAVVLSGLQPLFVDVDPQTGQITPAIAAAALRADVAAVLVVSPFGQRVSSGPWEDFQRESGVAVVIDAAAGFDTVSPSSLATVVSLHATKPVGCGEGGFVLSTDASLIARLHRRSNFGFDSRRCAVFAGLNAKMSEYHAAVAHASLDQWPVTRAHLMYVGQAYRERLREVADVQEGWAKTWISSTLNVRCRQSCNVASLVAQLAAAGIETRAWWGAGCHVQPVFEGYSRAALPATQEITRTTLGLPFFSQLSQRDVGTIVDRLACALRDSQSFEVVK
jgi:dTDP-4-amino-4,6-dideoxygalactose transaminase